MKTTITDVAKEAGVSMKTVSRVLNNEPNVAKATRDRVMEAADRLDYSPNLAARGLASSRSYLIALIYDNPSPSYISNLQRGAVAACRANGYHLVLDPMRSETAHGDTIESRLRRLGVDGVVIAPPLSNAGPLREAVVKLGLDHALIGPSDPADRQAVLMDDAEASRQMTQHLIELGHTEIGFIEGPSDHSSSAQRLRGFRAAMEGAGLSVTPDHVRRGDFTFASGVEAAQALLGSPASRPTAIFASNDDMAAGTMQVAARLGLDVPGDLSVCGFDDTPIARMVWPQLTTVAQPIRRMGEVAVAMLIDRSRHEEPRVQTLDFDLVIRDTTAAPG
ncbi:MAG: LacI family DNA-binding transcriptional regulator [Litorimonas sp.]